MSDKNMTNPVEISIPVPWGHIAGKAWGNSSHQRVLAIHGKQDNCGAFDRLIKLLKGSYYIIAIDLPGHGFSSHFPPGLYIHMINYVVAIVDVIKHLKWQRFHLLTHSLGGQIGMFLNALVPHLIDKFIVIDHIAPSYTEDESAVDYFKQNLDDFFKMEEKMKHGKPPVYSYQVALEKLTNRESVLTNDAAKIILERSLKKIDGGFTFCMDQRIKLHSFPSLTVTMWNNVLRKLNCPTLYIFSSERLSVYEIMFHSSFKLIKQKPNVTIKTAHGNHDLHQNHPERIAPLIDEFFSKERSKL
ncbi:serine hydrolase-like protein isoform X2 [Planococcus citri]|uniref:serine hydrolase-like protein isoform X2 n=1 Tax=Planococcus citri TaxID=170843 RepID=UPI0031F934DE